MTMQFKYHAVILSILKKILYICHNKAIKKSNWKLKDGTMAKKNF